MVGGSDGQSSLASVEYFDPDHMTWTHGPAMAIARANVSVAVLSDRLFAVGGFSGKHFLDSIEYLGGKDKKEWCSFAARLSSGTSDGSGESEVESNCESEAGDHVTGKSGAKMKRGAKSNGIGKSGGAKLKEGAQNGEAVIANGGAKYGAKLKEGAPKGDTVITNGHMDDLEVQDITDKVKICNVSSQKAASNGLTNGHSADAQINGTSACS